MVEETLSQQSSKIPVLLEIKDAADFVVCRPASTSVKTSIRCKSRLLTLSQPNLSPPNLNSGWSSDTLALQSYDMIALHLHLYYT